MPTRIRAFIALFTGMVMVSSAQSLTTLVNFSGSNGGEPFGSLVLGTDGNFYGTTSVGGPNGAGTVFKITPGGTLTTLHSFNVTDGQEPLFGLVQATDGNFYGTTQVGGASNQGTIFKITPGGTLTTLYSFTGYGDGSNPQGTLIQASDGNLYGTTAGAVFKITLGGTFTTWLMFTGSLDPGLAQGLVQASDGNLYGTSDGGGANGQGCVFKVTPGGTLATLHSFTVITDGYGPHGSLVQGTDGNFYGTNSLGGAYSEGTVFEITPGGVFTTLHSFDTYTFPVTDGSEPAAGLIQATDGNFYGTTGTGGANNFGTIFKITPSGTLTTLHSFNGTDGAVPGGLVEGTDGNLYGTTAGGGSAAAGTVFKLQTALPPPTSTTPAITLVQNAEGGASTIAPNTWVTIKGASLAPAGDSRIWQASDFVGNQMPTQLDGVGVAMNGESAYVYYISPAQINVLTPPDLAAGPVQVQVTTSAGTSASFTAQAQQVSPSFFIFGGGPYVAATHLDGTLIGPTSLYPGQSTPAKAGETIIVYANGFGPVSPPVVKGSSSQSGSLTPLPNITIGGAPATVQFAGLISPGLFQFNVVVPASATAGDNAVAATYNGASSQAGTLLTVQP